MKLNSFLLFYISLGLLMFQSCNDKPHKMVEQPLSTTQQEASGAYFTHDHQGNSVLCWTEKDDIDSLNRLKYAVFDAATDVILPIITDADFSISPH